MVSTSFLNYQPLGVEEHIFEVEMRLAKITLFMKAYAFLNF